MKTSAKQRKQLFDQIFELKYLNKQLLTREYVNASIATPQLNSHAKKCQQDERVQQRKAKAALDAGNTEIARTYASNAIRKKNEAIQYIKLASRLDATISRLNQQGTLTQVNASTESITKSINKVLSKVDADKLLTNMTDFGEAMEQLETATSSMERAMGDQAARLDDQKDVDELLRQLEDDNAMTFRERGTGVAVSRVKPATAVASAEEEAEPVDFMAELTSLRGA